MCRIKQLFSDVNLKMIIFGLNKVLPGFFHFDVLEILLHPPSNVEPELASFLKANFHFVSIFQSQQFKVEKVNEVNICVARTH